jgi:hypothetical protein
LVEAAVIGSVFVHHRKITVAGVGLHPVLDCRVLDRDPNYRMRGYVLDAVAAKINRAAIGE